MGKIGRMMRKVEAMMNRILTNQNQAPVVNNTPGQSAPAPVNGVELNDPAVAALLQTFTKALQDGGDKKKKNH